MSGNKVIKLEEFAKAINTLDISKPKANKGSTGQKAFINLNGKSLNIQIPKAKCPFGSRDASLDGKSTLNAGKPVYYVNGANKDRKFFIEVECDDKLLSIMEKFEERVLNWGVENSKALFKDDFSAAELIKSKKFTGVLTEHKEGSAYPRRLRSQVWTNDDRTLGANFYESEKVNGSYPMITVTADNVNSIISSGTQLEQILMPTIWIIAGKSFGVNFKLIQAKVFPNDNGKLTDFGFCEDSENESESVSEKDNVSESVSESESEKEKNDDELIDELDDLVIEEPKAKKPATRKRK